MASDCPACQPLNWHHKRSRYVGITPQLRENDSAMGKMDLVISHGCWKGRFGRARVRCACKPGSVRIGASTSLIWGKNGKSLLEQFTGNEDKDLPGVPDPIVILLIFPGSSLKGRAVATIQEACAEQGRQCFVYSMSEPIGLLIDRDASPPVQPGWRTRR